MAAKSKVLSTRKAAEFYIALGWEIIPVWPIRNGRCACGDRKCKSPGKHPIGHLVPNGVKDASCELRLIQQWWNQVPDANIGVATGNRSGVFVVDIDSLKGGNESWADLVSRYGRAVTVEQESGGGGTHYFFNHVPGLGNSSGKLGPGIDTRGEGGYILVTPSNHISGNRYEWEVSSHPKDVPLADIPDWLLALLITESNEEPTVTFSENGLSKPNLAQFQLTELVRATIVNGHQNGSDRSAVDQSIISALVKGGATDNQILAVFQHYPIGQDGKFTEKGNHGKTYLAHSIEQAREHLGQFKTVEASNHQVLNLRTVSVAALLAQQFDPLIFLVDGMIALGYLVVLAGRPKSGKSWLGLQLAVCVDTGRPFLGRETRKSRVLLIALEDGDRRVYQRAHLLKWVPSDTAVLALNIAHFDGPNGTPGPGLIQIEQAASCYDLIIIDTLIATLSGQANENDNVQMAMIVNSLARIAHETNTAVVLVHHTGKGYSDDVFNTLRGASAIRGGYDVGLLLERKQGEQEAVLHAESRDIDVENMTLCQAANGAGWEYVGNSFEIEKIRAGRDTLKAMLELAPGGAGLTAKEIAKHRNITESAVYNQLNRLVEDGYIERLEKPSTGDGKEADLFFVREKYL